MAEVEDIDLGNGMMLRQLPEGSYTYPKTLPTEQTTLDSDPFAVAAARMRRSVVHDRPLTPYEAPTNKPYIVEPDLVEAQQGHQELPTGYRLNDLNIPYNIQTGKEDLPVVRRPNVLPVAMTPNGPAWAMPKILDVVSNIMGGIGAPAVATKAGEVVLGSGAVRTAGAVDNVTQFEKATQEFITKNNLPPISQDQLISNMKARIKQIEYDRRITGKTEGEPYPHNVELSALRNRVKELTQPTNTSKFKLTPVEGNPFNQPWDVKGFENADWFHGTTHDFDKFKLNKGNPENYLGQYPHFTTSPEDAAANYAGKGPDLTARIERRTEEIFDKVRDKYRNGEVGDDYGKVMTKAKEQATKELAGPHEGAIIPAKMKLENPASLVDSKPTWLDFNAKYDKDGKWVKDSPNIIKLLNSLKKQGEKYGFNGQKVFDDVAEKAALYEGDVKASALDKALRESGHMLDASNNKGNLVSSHVISNVFKDLGFDGIVMDAKSAFPHMKNIPEGTLHAVPLKQNTVKGKYNDKILYSDTRPQVTAAVGHALEKQNQPFFSALERAVGDAKLTKASPEQWLGYLRNQPGVKSEEINTVLRDLPEGPITKEQLQGIVKDNGVKLGEVVKGEFSSSELDAALVRARETGNWAEYDRLLNQAKSNETSNTKHHSYQLSGGEAGSYKEMLLTLPPTPKVKEVFEVRPREGKNPFAVYVKGEKEHMRSFPTKEEAEVFAAKQNEHAFETSSDFKSSHWDEPNVVAHIRHNDRKIPVEFTPEEKIALQKHEEAQPYLEKLSNSQNDVAKRISETVAPLERLRRDKIMSDYKNKIISGPEANKALEEYIAHPEIKPLQDKLAKLRKQEDNVRAALPTRPEAKSSKTLHLEEWQSDLHQQGRDKGYVGEKEKLQPEFDKIENKLMATNDEKLLGQPTVKGVLKDAIDKKIITQEEANTYKRYTDIENQTPVPDLPFKKNWEEVALKRALHKAATEGYEGLSWTPGEAQALRYQNDIRQKLNSVDWHDKKMGKPDPEGNKQILVTPAHGSEIELTVNKNGEILKGHPELKGKGLDSVLGKDIAKQVLEKGEGNIDAKGYVMNSEGMKAAYDKRGVDILNNIAKKYGSKVEGKDIPVDATQRSLSHFVDWAIENGYKVARPDLQTKWSKGLDDPLVKKFMESKKEQPIHYLPITPELRQRAKQGFPLFSTSPTLTVVQHDPFSSDNNKFKLTPVDYDPFK